MPSIDCSWVDVAFPLPAQRKLNVSVRDAIAHDPQYTKLFVDIGSYINSIRDGSAATEPVSKRRKLDTPTSGASPAPTPPAVPKAALTTDGAVLTVEAISFTVPQRKKFSLLFTAKSVSAVTSTGTIEFGVEYDDIDYVCCLPVPDKATRMWNFCIFPAGADGLGDGSSSADALVFSIPDGSPKTASGIALGCGLDTTSYRSLLIGLFNSHLKTSKAKTSAVEEPKESVFYSMIPQSHRKGEKAFHIKAHRGSKEGYLFFLQRGILWGFKKPLVYFSFADIDSVSYTSITKRTFNLSVKVQEDRGGAELEFSMIDQEDYPGIDGYIKARRLNDASMAETRRAKKYNVNGKAADGGDGGGDGGEASVMGDLEQALADAEDEEEEDYVPGGGSGDDAGDAGGDSDGSGSSDDDDDDDDSDSDGNEEMESDGEHSVDLQDELGSEMEDVEPDAPKPKRTKRAGRV